MVDSSRSIRRSYVFALSLVAALSAGTHWLMASSLARGRADAELVNVAGRQRMLSQRIAATALDHVGLGRPQASRQLVEALDELEAAHAWLLAHPSTSDGERRMLEDLSQQQAQIVSLGRGVLAHRSPQALPSLVEATDAFLPRMHAVVGRYQRASELRRDRLHRATQVLGMLVLLTLVAEVAFVFEPLRRRLLRYTDSLIRARRDAEDAAQAKSDLLATMTHEIRTPLTGIIGMGELLERSELKPDQAQLTASLTSSATSLKQLIDDVLDAARMDDGGLELEALPFELEPWVDAVSAPIAFLLDPEAVELIVELEPGLPQEMLGDPTRLRQIVTNLAGNAAKFTERGHLLLRFGPRRGGSGLRIEVEDTGIGIPEERREAIFERFTQVDASTSRRFGGSGLGLSIVRKLVRQMGGSLSLDSEVGVGSRFTVEVPLEGRAAAASGGQAEPGSQPLAGRQIWAVEDHPTNRRLLEAALRQAGAAVRCFEGPADLNEALQGSAERPDALLIDQRLDGLSGRVLASQLAQRDGLADLPRVLLGSDDGRDAQRLFMGQIPKPLRPTRVLHGLLEVLDGTAGRAGSPPSSTARAMGPAEPARGPFAGVTVLGADDNAINRRLLQAQLAGLGIQFELVTNGAQAVERARAMDFDLILLDVQMPVLDGLQAAQQIRRLARHTSTPVIAMTANDGAEDRARCGAVGMVDLLGKPYSGAELRAVLTRWLPHGRLGSAG